MPESHHSAFLLAARPLLKEVIGILSSQFDYISVLCTDDNGISYAATPGETRTAEPMWVQRGFVFRAQKQGKVAEYAVSNLEVTLGAQQLADDIAKALHQLLASPGLIAYPAIPDQALTREFSMQAAEDPFMAEPEQVLSRLTSLRETLTDRKVIVMAQSRYEYMRVSRMFLSPRRDLIQTFPWSQAYLFGISRRDQLSKMSYRSVSGRKGLELLQELETTVPDLTQELHDILDATPIEPGEYEVILDPDMAGTLAHEAFGHGVETDMFFKKRAKATEYLGKRVGSELVTMYDGAADAEQTGFFLFDDEGTLAHKTKIIDHGILLGGISDMLSSLALHIPQTGNGRREAFSHKAYARMTNTYFEPGTATLEEMIASVKHGWQLSRLNAGMEDPRNWGIQLLCMVGREIVNGTYTGRVASPIVCSGYVPDVLSAISMVSKDFALSGSGACGKGKKEYVKVSSGGPYVKTRMRLG